MLRNVPLSKEVVQIILVLTAENANLSLKMIMNVFVVKNSGKKFFNKLCYIFPLVRPVTKKQNTKCQNFGWYLLFSIWLLAYQM